MVLRITAAGRAALADADNVGISAVRITKVLVGSGQGPGGADDDARVALRNQRDSAVAGGTTMVPARVLVRGDVAATAAYNITEIGLEAQIGAEAPFLFAYWTNAGEVFAAAVDGVLVLVIAAIDVVAETPADLTVDVSPTVQAQFSSTFAELTDTQAGALVPLNYYRANADGTRLVAMTDAEVLADLFSGVASARYVRKSGQGFEALTRGEVAKDLLATIGNLNFLRRADNAGGFEGLTAAAAAAAWLAAAPPRLLTYTASGSVQGPAYACRWIVVAVGAGAGGNAQHGKPAQFTDGGAGGESSLVGGGQAIRAAGGTSVARDAAGGVPGGGSGGLVITGGGAAGGSGGSAVTRAGRPGGLVLAMITPQTGTQYAITVGAGGAAAAQNANARDGSDGGVAILELRGP